MLIIILWRLYVTLVQFFECNKHQMNKWIKRTFNCVRWKRSLQCSLWVISKQNCFPVEVSRRELILMLNYTKVNSQWSAYHWKELILHWESPFRYMNFLNRVLNWTILCEYFPYFCGKVNICEEFCVLLEEGAMKLVSVMTIQNFSNLPKKIFSTCEYGHTLYWSTITYYIKLATFNAR